MKEITITRKHVMPGDGAIIYQIMIVKEDGTKEILGIMEKNLLKLLSDNLK